MKDKFIIQKQIIIKIIIWWWESYKTLRYGPEKTLVDSFLQVLVRVRLVDCRQISKPRISLIFVTLHMVHNIIERNT